MGNPHASGIQKPITFYRQVLGLCDLPPTNGIDNVQVTKFFPADVVQRAREYLNVLQPGAYTDPRGLQYVRDCVANFIAKRDGLQSLPDAENIILTNGASNAIQFVLSTLVKSLKDGIMVPSFHYPIYSQITDMLGGTVCEYELDEATGWSVTKEALQKCYERSIEQGVMVRAFCIINPGNPTGHVMDEEELQCIMSFCTKHDIFLIADEVYQENIHNDQITFVSAKKACCNSEIFCTSLKLISIHSASKGFAGECGRRGGYMEMHNCPSGFKENILKMIADTLPCANTAGQIIMGLIANPPNPNDASYCQFEHERNDVLSTNTRRIHKIAHGLNSIPGLSCQLSEGSLYVFVMVALPQRAIEEAERLAMHPDAFYCKSLLQETNINVVPASEYSYTKSHHRYGFRMTCLLQDGQIDTVLELIESHHNNFTRKYRRSALTAMQVNTVSTTDYPRVMLHRLDHYTLICDDAKRVSQYHINQLGFNLIRTVDVNTGTVSSGEVDMLNYVLRPPGNTDMCIVITEGLNDDTVFRKYMKKFGDGIHHVAFEVENIDQVFSTMRKRGIQTTADSVTTDMLSGLKQFFIDPKHAGFIIELIERPKVLEGVETVSNSCRNEILSVGSKADSSEFTKDNMSSLANSMHGLLSDFSDQDSSNCESYVDVDCYGTGDCFKQASDVELDKILSVGFAVEEIEQSMKFLTSFFNLRFARHHSKGNRHFLKMYDNNGIESELSIFVQSPSTLAPSRNGHVYFSAKESTQVENFSQRAFHIPNNLLTYDLTISAEHEISKYSKIIKFEGYDKISLDINMDQRRVIEFLLHPPNLTCWTGHKNIYYSYSMSQWFESRIDDHGNAKDFVLEIYEEGSDVYFSWPERRVDIHFATTASSSFVTNILVTLPQMSMKAKLLAKLKRMLVMELNVLKAILEAQMQSIPTNVLKQIQGFHFDIYGMKAPLPNVVETKEMFHSIKGELITCGPLFEKMSTDFALTVHSQPTIIIQPVDADDIKVAIHIANQCGMPLVVRGSQISHSAGGQSQSNGGIILDLSEMSTIQPCDESRSNTNNSDLSCFVFVHEDKGVKCNSKHCENFASFVKVGAGAFWNDVVQYSLDQGLMPPVVNDYQYLSVGGTISMGGVGFMSHKYGIQAGHICDMTMVTGIGDKVFVSPDINADLFDVCRGGLGQFGVITEVTIPLIPAPKTVLTIKMFYTEENGHTDFMNDVKRFCDLGVDMIHAFLKVSFFLIVQFNYHFQNCINCFLSHSLVPGSV